MKLYLTKAIAILFVIALATTSMSLSVKAQGLSILRDAETEAFLRRIGTPIFQAARLTPENINIYLVNDKSINAFVTGGQNIFFHSGLLMRMDNVDELFGVMAHETGHISGGHSVRTREAFGKASGYSIASMVLGVAAILAGSADAGIAAMMAGQQMTMGSMLTYSRNQEATTDQAGASYLEKNNISGKGLITFFKKLQEQEFIYSANRNPYMRTHPLTQDRISRLEYVVTTSENYNKPPNQDLNNQFLRIRAKLEGYINGPFYTLKKYPLSDQSIPAKYARIYAYHRALEWDKALAEVEDLIKIEPENPYFYEIKGQVLFESGKLEEAAAPLKKATKLAPNEALILTAYAQALLSVEGKDGLIKKNNLQLALPLLKDATRLDNENTFAWYNLAKVYSALDDKPKASLATAERFFSMGALQQADYHANMAKKEFREGTIDWLRAEDIILISQPYLEKMRNSKRRSSRRRVLQE
ncbi:M48 family metalloprotease [Temperatibacter marinus]|uniref:M48 family metalloprotease n=1 Tax=Temperatibacter marinus TaxID=1456591 RepID=A0AA52EGW0_9PROT|nr:M48 family metalloprotease [Temperatibacter marinus]WND02284.1 M48 family metalloprotease [Temperatibacter marinus]